MLRAALVVLLVAACGGSSAPAPAQPAGPRKVISDTRIEILDPILFDGDAIEPTAASFRLMDAVADTLVGNPTILEVEVQVHTAAGGDPDADLRLTQQRADYVRDYLIRRGVPAERLSAQGYGQTQPIVPATDPAAAIKNRRVAFLILKRKNQ